MKAAFDALVVKWEIGFCCTCLEHLGETNTTCCFVATFTAIIEYATFVNLFSAQLVFSVVMFVLRHSVRFVFWRCISDLLLLPGK